MTHRFSTLLLNTLFFSVSLYGSFIVPLTFQCSKNYQSSNNQTFSVRVNNFLTESLVGVQDCANKCGVSSVQFYMRAVEHAINHFSIENSQKLLDNVASLEALLTARGIIERSTFETLRVAIIVKAMEQLLQQAHKASFKTLVTLETHKKYWDQQYAHPGYYFFHRSPLKWFSKSSRKAEVNIHKKCIEEAQYLHQKLIGQISLLISKFDGQMNVEDQYSWIKDCCVQISQTSFVPSLEEERISRQSCPYIIKQLSNSFNTYNQCVLKELRYALMPSHIERNWALYTGIVAAAVGGYCYFHRNPHGISDGYKKVSDFCVENYMNHIKDPLLGIKDAFSINKNEADSAGQQLKKIVNDDLRPSVESLEQLKKDYFSKISTINQEFGLQFDMKDIQQKALALDEDFLDNLIQTVGSSWEKGGLFFESYWNPFQETTKFKITNKCPGLGILYARVLKANTKSFLAEVSEIAITRMDKIDFDFKEIQQKKLNLVLAVVGFLPAVGFLWGTYKGIRSFGGYLLPRGYDDTPVKTYIIKMQGLLDDAQYVKGQESFNGLEAQSIGALFYYSARLEYEIKYLTHNHRILLQQLLEKFYLSVGLQGKKVYLEKMLHEYYSWPRFIQR